MPLSVSQLLTVPLVKSVLLWLVLNARPALKVRPVTPVLQRYLLAFPRRLLLLAIPLLQVQAQALRAQLPLILIVDLANLQVAVQVQVRLFP
jgi:heme/copper-type cytochrome/quinol oxidase subunit 4